MALKDHKGIGLKVKVNATPEIDWIREYGLVTFHSSPIEYPCPFMVNRADSYQVRNKHRWLAKVGREAVNLWALLLLLCPTALPLRIHLRLCFHCAFLKAWDSNSSGIVRGL